jgi:hypothetical protein
VIWLTRKARLAHIDVQQSERALAEALDRRARTRRVAVGIERAILQNHYTADIETIMEGRR